MLDMFDLSMICMISIFLCGSLNYLIVYVFGYNKQ